jgi:hypothetical protein
VISARCAATSRSMCAPGTGHSAVNRIAHLNLSSAVARSTISTYSDDSDTDRRAGRRESVRAGWGIGLVRALTRRNLPAARAAYSRLGPVAVHAGVPARLRVHGS